MSNKDQDYFTLVLQGDITKIKSLFDDIPGYGKVVGVAQGNLLDVEEEFINAIDYACEKGDTYWLAEWADGNPEAIKELKKYVKKRDK